MKYAITQALIVFLLFVSATARSQPNNGTVAFDCPNVPSSEFQFDLDRRVIALVMEDPNSAYRSRCLAQLTICISVITEVNLLILRRWFNITAKS